MTRTKRPKKQKVEIVFDPQKRKDFLTGFRKRKNERRSRAKAELEKNLKKERKRIRQELKDGLKHLKKSYEPLRELTEEDKETNENNAYEDDEVQVNIVELSTNDLAKQRNMLGQNTAGDSDGNESDNDNDAAAHSSDEETQNTNCIPGMDFDVNATNQKRKSKIRRGGGDAEAEQSAAGQLINGKKPALEFDVSKLQSKKDIDRLMKTKTLKKMKKSKVFKMKERIDKKANQKKAKRDRNNTIKNVPKHQQKKLKNERSKTRYRKGRLMNKKELRRKGRGAGD